MELNLTLTRLFKYIGRTFLFVFDRFTMQRNVEHKTRQQIKKSIDCVFGIRTWGQGILGKDKSTELFNLRFVINKNILFNLQHLFFHVLAPLTSSVRIGAGWPRPQTLQMYNADLDGWHNLKPERAASSGLKVQQHCSWDRKISKISVLVDPQPTASVWPEENRQMSIKVTQKWFHLKKW